LFYAGIGRYHFREFRNEKKSGILSAWEMGAWEWQPYVQCC